MTRRLLPLLSLAGLLACRESEPQPIEIVQGDPFAGDGSTIAGGGASAYVAYTRWDSSAGKTSLRIVRHDAARPDELEVVGDVNFGGGTSSDAPCLHVSEAAVAVCAGLAIDVIDLADPGRPATSVPVAEVPGTIALTGRWLLGASGTTLLLVDVTGQAPTARFTAPAPVTALLATQGTFLAFTTSGYVHVTPDPTSPAFEATTDPVVRSFRGAFADGVEALVAGPSSALGKARLVRLDLRSPGAPVVLRSHEVDGEYAAFAWDGAATSVVAIRRAGAEMRDGWVVREDGETFSSHGIPLPQRWGSWNPIAAHADRLFVVSYGGFGLFRIR